MPKLTRHPGFNVIGHITGNLGLGVLARNVLRTLVTLGYPVAAFDVDPGLGRGRHDLSLEGLSFKAPDELPYGINLFVLPAPSLQDLLPSLERLVLNTSSINVALPMWELSVLPPGWKAIFEFFDVVVAGSTFIRSTFDFSLSNTFVVQGHQPIFLPGDVRADRKRFGIPEEKTVFLTAYEPQSDPHRKNPEGAITAFLSACSDDPDTLLVVKANNAAVDGVEHPSVTRLRRLADGSDRILFLTGDYPYADVLSLLASVDVVVSLHRAEGLGLVPMEAMALGKPVVATAWSGNMAYMDHTNACLVDHELRPVEGSAGIYERLLSGVSATWAEPNLVTAAAWMKKLANDPAFRVDLGREAKAGIEAHNAEALRGVYLDELGAVYSHRDILCPKIVERRERFERLCAPLDALIERDRSTMHLADAVARNRLLSQELEMAEAKLSDLHASTSWRVTAPMRFISSNAPRIGGMLKLLPSVVRTGGGVAGTAGKAARILYREGLPGVKARLQWVSQQPAVVAPAPIICPSQADRLRVVPYYVDPRIDAASPAEVNPGPVAVHLHIYYDDMLESLASRLSNIPCAFDLYVSVPPEADVQGTQARLRQAVPEASIIVVEAVPNRGRDLAPLIVQFGARLRKYWIIGHFHTKRSPHNQSLQSWLGDILEHLLGRPQAGGGRVAHIFGLLEGRAKVVFPEGHREFIHDQTGWAGNYEIARNLLNRHTTLSIDDFPVVEFPQGAMFWARGECLKDFLGMPLTFEDFPTEPIGPDGTMAHALERLILIMASPYEGQCIRLQSGDSIPDYRAYETQQDYAEEIIHGDIRVLAYYLPQFHPIPENDTWHGTGFTDWTKVRAATPLFRGHYQQHIPHPVMGYYLLDSPETLRKQAELMRQSGVRGQVFYHYWFSGELILEEPARMLLANPDIVMPFCFCWANENWTRSWDGNENDILLNQTYSAQDARDFIRYLIPFFGDERYIRVDGRPVLFVYRPSSIPDSRQYLDIWANECAALGLSAPYVVAVLTRGAAHPAEFGMDAGVERVLHDWTAGGAPEIKEQLEPYEPINGSVLSYDDVADFYIAQTAAKEFDYFRSLVPMWDNTARYGSEALVVHGSTPERFQEWLESIIQFTKQTLPADRRFVLVNAWNEWAEGAHLEPDTRYGYAYLNAIGRALSGIPYADCHSG